jgi:hypothetical protein
VFCSCKSLHPPLNVNSRLIFDPSTLGPSSGSVVAPDAVYRVIKQRKTQDTANNRQSQARSQSRHYFCYSPSIESFSYISELQLSIPHQRLRQLEPSTIMFTIFPELAPELRVKIWKLALPLHTKALVEIESGRYSTRRVQIIFESDISASEYILPSSFARNGSREIRALGWLNSASGAFECPHRILF